MVMELFLKDIYNNNKSKLHKPPLRFVKITLRPKTLRNFTVRTF